MNERKRVTKNNFSLEVKNSDAIGFIHKNGDHYGCKKTGFGAPSCTGNTVENGYVVKCDFCKQESEVFTFEEMKLPHPIFGESPA